MTKPTSNLELISALALHDDVVGCIRRRFHGAPFTRDRRGLARHGGPARLALAGRC
ncbi:hypothetical protein G7Z99_02865 [Pseudomonas entomophila]|uniref:hypothetical protein n=1 Tax=Pseudomonas entomophila TaxID=312306 RepID=UPI0015E42B23|nr:hypothetical protein [Pseudomonas entomophila]MBA1187980.1 hypothetical protein [Pseudomonas entomophila]